MSTTTARAGVVSAIDALITAKINSRNGSDRWEQVEIRQQELDAAFQQYEQAIKESEL